MKYLFILNDSPYGSERTYNALRLARSLSTSHTEVAVFLLGDGVVTGLRRQSPADASYNVQEMLRMLGPSVSIAACRTCLEARGIDDHSLVEGVQRRTLDDLRDWTEEAEKVLVF
ncbi:MAG TPA: DsrE family protein [Dongiaceae bacterium]|nr:DsrE family protein [Dongiaceae bacterium]